MGFVFLLASTFTKTSRFFFPWIYIELKLGVNCIYPSTIHIYTSQHMRSVKTFEGEGFIYYLSFCIYILTNWMYILWVSVIGLSQVYIIVYNIDGIICKLYWLEYMEIEEGFLYWCELKVYIHHKWNAA